MKKTKKTFDFPSAYRQLQSLEFALKQSGAVGDERKTALKAYCSAERAFTEALKTLPKPRRCKHAKREDGKCTRCGIKFVPCPGQAHSFEVGGMQDHCMVCLNYGWGEVPEHKPNEAINEMLKELP